MQILSVVIILFIILMKLLHLEKQILLLKY